MTQEEKQLLLKDLSARLSYGVKIKYLYWDEDKGCEYPVPMILDDINSDGYIRFHGDIKEEEGRGYILTYLPYLRLMSSMTEEEKKELKEEHKKDETAYAEVLEKISKGDESARGTAIPHFAADWCNAHHFDYRGLIDKGLALEAHEGMYEKF